MFFPQHITRATAVALVAGAIAAPVASAMPIDTHFHHPLGGPNHPVPLASNPLGSPTYLRQDKQFVPSRPSPPPTNPGTVARITGMGQTGAAAAYVAAHRLQTPAQTSAAAPSTGSSFDWGDAGIGAAGGLALAMLGVGGGLALSQCRSRRTGTSAVVTG
jgi:hypothetical protein